MGDIARDMLKEIKNNLSNDSGPSFLTKWLYWKYSTSIQISNYNIQNELRNILSNNPVIFILFCFYIYFRITNQHFLMMI